MPNDDGWMVIPVCLPAAVGQDLDAGRHFKQTFLISFGGETKSPRPEIGRHRLRVAVTKKGMWFERIALKRFGYVREKGCGGCDAGGGLG
jgi:hypothetical protein